MKIKRKKEGGKGKEEEERKEKTEGQRVSERPTRSASRDLALHGATDEDLPCRVLTEEKGEVVSLPGAVAEGRALASRVEVVRPRAGRRLMMRRASNQAEAALPVPEPR